MLKIAQISVAVVSALILGYLTQQLWQNRFDASAHHASFNLDLVSSDLVRTEEGTFNKNQNSVVMPAGTPAPRITFQWDKAVTYDYALVSMRVGTKQIIPGNYVWENGRIELNWHDPDEAKKISILAIWSGSETHSACDFEAIVPMHYGQGTPKLMIHNMGRSGELDVEKFHFQPLQQRKYFHLKLIALMSVWAIWMIGMTAIFDKVSWWRRILASAAALWFTWYASFPGPWPIFMPLGNSFAVHKTNPAPPPPPVALPAIDTAAQQPITPPVAADNSASISGMEALPVASAQQHENATHLKKSSISLRIRFARITDWIFSTIPDLKRCIHLAIFGGMFLLIYILAGERIALGICTLLSANSEFCEWAQGYGFDFGDVLDLLVDLCGILLAWFVARWILKITHRLYPRHKKTDCPA